MGALRSRKAYCPAGIVPGRAASRPEDYNQVLPLNSDHCYVTESEMRSIALLSLVTILPGMAYADLNSFTPGPVIENYGPVADVDITVPVPKDTVLRHSFDVAKRADDGELNRTLVSAARFINMHARAGVDADHIKVAVVVHGTAVHDVSRETSGSAGLIAALIDRGVRIFVCGQSAAYYDVTPDDLLPGVEMALSAMTVHALLQQQGYSLNPF
jgi:intracellular sulfur oxidation DsrE/DsrF family protein